MNEIKPSAAQDSALQEHNSFQSLGLRAMFWRPVYLEQSAWLEHIPFAFWLIEAQQPKTLVELGTGHGTSYFAFCQAVDRLGSDTRCFAVDAWKDDNQLGHSGNMVYAKVNAHNEANFSGFSTIVRSDSSDVLDQFSEGSVDLLHLNGQHSLEAIRRDFENWLPKLSKRAIVVIPNTNVRERGAGAAKLFDELCLQYPVFEFMHGQGLAVFGIGVEQRTFLERLYHLNSDEGTKKAIQEVFARLGRACADSFSAREQLERANSLHAEVSQQKKQLDEFRASLDKTKADLTTRSKDLTETRNRLQNQIEQHAAERGQLSERVALYQELRGELKEEVARLRAKTVEISAQLELRILDLGRLDAANMAHQRQFEELRSNLQERDSRVTTLVQERGKLQAELKVMQDEVESNVQRLKTVSEEIKENALRITTLEGSLQEAERRVAAMVQALQERDNENVLLKKQLDEGKVQLANAEHALASSKRMQEEHHAELKALKGRLASADAALATSTRAQEVLKERNQALAGELQSREQSISALQADSHESKAIIEAVNRERDEHKSLLAESQDALAVSKLEGEAKHLEIASLKDELHGLKQTIAALGTEKKEKQAVIAAMVENLATSNAEQLSASAQVDALLPTLAQHEQTIALLSAEVANQTEKNNHLVLEKKSQGELLARLTAEKNEQTTLHQADKKEIVRLQQQLETVEESLRQKESLQRQVNIKSAAAQKADEEISRLNEELRVSKTENANLSRKLDIRFTELAQLTQILEDSSRNRLSMDERIASLQSDLVAADQKISDLISTQQEVEILQQQLQRAKHEGENYFKLLAEHIARITAPEISDIGSSKKFPLRSKKRSKAERTLADVALLRQSGLFNEAWYVARYPDILTSNIDPATHYLKYGGAEGRDPGPLFSTTQYVRAYIDVAESGMNPLLHFIKHGSKEGRTISSVEEF